MLTREILRAKRDGRTLTGEQIGQLVAGMSDGSVGDGELGAFAMAVFLNGMDEHECMLLTEAMRDSGRVLDWHSADLPGPVLDKHSTGGVGDAVSLILGPWIAACGGFVPMISGHGLGHTGGTLDKLAAIPGYDTSPDLATLTRVVRETGVAIIGQTAELTPADRRFYAIRDLTATVESIPLIVSSILSKKLAEGLGALVMDVKTGSGSVMGEIERARELSGAIARVAAGTGTPVTALISDMNQVLANNAGNALELREAIGILTGRITHGRLLELTRELATEMLLAGSLADSRDRARGILDRTMATGAAAECFARMVAALGGPVDLIERHDQLLPRAPVEFDVEASNHGYVQAIDVHALGLAVVELGGGRWRSGENIDLSVGLQDVAGIGEATSGRPLARVHARTREDARRAAARVRAAFTIDHGQPEPPPLIHQTIRQEEN